MLTVKMVFFNLSASLYSRKKSLNDGKEISELQLSLLIYIDEQWTYCQWRNEPPHGISNNVAF